jgi:hypothetical protein
MTARARVFSTAVQFLGRTTTLIGLLCTLHAPLIAQTSPESRADPEEPDFAFISGSAYTQVKNTMQIIHQSSYGTRRFPRTGGFLHEDQYQFFQRVEYGITDRWETDFQLPVQGSRTRMDGSTVESTHAFGDGLVGLRYRFLDEEKAPVTLTMGPQIIFPSGSVSKGTGSGSTGFAWDVAVSKDRRGPVFLYTTANYHAFPCAQDPTPGSSERFLLSGVNFAAALGIRALERDREGSHHDIHVFLEGGGAWEQQIDRGATAGTRGDQLSWVVSPGIRYGYLTSRKTLVEIGFSAPIGLGPNGPKHGFILQFQYEFYFRPPER